MNNPFFDLCNPSKPLLLTNVWDAASASIVTNSGATAIATSSASLAWACGYPDGGAIPKQEFIAAVSRIKRVSKLPLSIDIENGYSGEHQQVAKLAKALCDIGVAGINIEDGSAEPDELVAKIRAIKKLNGEQIFINARTDVYLANLTESSEALKETIRRLALYIEAGADGVFIPGLQDPNSFFTIKDSLKSSKPISINAMVSTIEEIAPFLNKGVNRFSTGSFPFLRAYSALTRENNLSFEQLNRYLSSEFI